jgi:hypothetical protein
LLFKLSSEKDERVFGEMRRAVKVNFENGLAGKGSKREGDKKDF